MTEHTGPAAVPMGTEGGHPHYPAGWPSPEAFEAAQRQLHREQVAREREQADKDDLEAETDRRIAAARGPQEAPEAVKPAPTWRAAVEPEAVK